MNPIILETMNDIINRVDAREWNRVNEHRFRMTDKFKKEKKKVQSMKDEIERLKDEIKLLKGDDDELDECFCCQKRFDSHEARYNMGESLRLKYIEYYGSENDDGDICPACIIDK